MNAKIHSNSASLLTETQAAEFLNLSIRSLQAWRVKGGGPTYCKIGRSVRYRRCDLYSFIESSLTTSTSQAGAK